MNLKFLSRVSNLLSITGDALPYSPQVNSRGDIIVVQAMPERAELVRMGRTFQAQMASAAAPVAALPTTTAMINLYNPNALGGPTYIIEAAFGVAVTSIATASVLSLVGMVNSAAQSNVQSGTIAKSNLSGSGNTSTGVVSVAATVTNQGWFPLASSAPSSGTTTVGLAAYAPVEGLIHVRPQCAFSLSALAEAAAGTVVLGIIWHEVQLVGN